MDYTIGQFADMVGMTSSALRYYDKEGLLFFAKRSSSGERRFSSDNCVWINVIKCLKKSGLSIKDIKRFLQLYNAGNSTVKERLDLFIKQRQEVQKRIEELQSTLEILDYKCWFYEEAVKHGSTEAVERMKDEKMPVRHRRAERMLNCRSYSNFDRD